MSDWRTLVEQRLNQVYNPHIDKRLPLDEAIRLHVKPGMKINPVSLAARATAATYELCRQFAGKQPEFEFISSSLSGNYLQLAYLGLIKKAIVAFAGEGYPTPGPSKAVGWAQEDHGMEIENWTMLTISQRLMAGAMGLPFFPTLSLKNSSIAEEARSNGHYTEIADPFNQGEPQGLISAYNPDIAFVHVWAADKSGNAVCFPPYQENVYGALGARKGVIITAQKIVDTDFIRRHSHLVRIPAERVLSVSEAPYGSHPYGNFCQQVAEFSPYANDYQFMKEHRLAQGKREDYQQWIEEWVLNVPDHAAYMKKLGETRVATLYEKAEPLSWQAELESYSATFDQEAPPTSVEKMIVQAARVMTGIATEKGYQTILCGAGQAAMMCWLAVQFMRDQNSDVSLMAETGMIGFDPRPSDPFLINYRNLPTCTLLTDVTETLGIHTCGSQNTCIAALGAGQLDKFGNVNSTIGDDENFLVGSGGANDITNAAKEVIVLAAQRKQTFVESVNYVTSPGTAVSTVISTRGVFKKNPQGELVLSAIFEEAGVSLEDSIASIRDNCGWKMKTADEVEVIPAVTRDDVALLRLFDPERFFLGKQKH